MARKMMKLMTLPKKLPPQDAMVSASGDADVSSMLTDGAPSRSAVVGTRMTTMAVMVAPMAAPPILAFAFLVSSEKMITLPKPW